jgi:hypothetical protein
METEDTPKLDLGSFDFTPDWAKKDAGVSVGRLQSERETFSRPSGERKSFGEHKPFAERKSFGERKPFGEKKPFADRGRPGARTPGEGDRFQKGGARGPRPFIPSEPVRPLEADIKILPETKALGTIIRKLQQDAHAYKLKDLAYFFLDNPSSVLLKVTPRPPAEGRDPVVFSQCKACGYVARSADDVAAHILTAHLGDYYDIKEIDCEPPKGNFNCVAKCGLSGVLLGPPNIHEFNGIVREMIRTRYPQMTEEQYRAHIEMVRDAESIDAWRNSAVKKTVFIPKGGGEDAPQLSREAAEGEFRRTILLSLIDTPKHLMLTVDVALKSPSPALQRAVKSALEAERRAPYNMCFALRGAFHHRKLKFFRANDAHGPEFVTGIELKPFDTEHAIAELAAVARFVADHPCAAKSDIAPDEETAKHLSWLVSTGHIVAFTNGVYSPVEKFPKYGPQWQKWKKAAAAPAAEIPPAEVPVAEVPAAETQTPAPASLVPPSTESEAAEPIHEEIKEEEKKDEASAQLAE